MKKMIVILMVLVLALTACSSSKTMSSVQGVQDTSTGKVQSSGTNYEENLIDVRTETVNKNDKGQELFVPIVHKEGKVGDTVTFGAIMNSINTRKGIYVAKVTFIGAKDKNSNPIETDKSRVFQWLNEAEIEFNLEEGSYAYFPVTVIVGNEIKSGTNTLSGNYQYEVKVYERKGSFDNEVPGIKNVELYVRVP